MIKTFTCSFYFVHKSLTIFVSVILLTLLPETSQTLIELSIVVYASFIPTKAYSMHISKQYSFNNIIQILSGRITCGDSLELEI
jgi:hypothetical protein